MPVPTPSQTREYTNRRKPEGRRKMVSSQYIGVDKYDDRRGTSRRKSDRFDKETWEKQCYENLGPGWL